MNNNQLTDAIVVSKDYMGFRNIAFVVAALSKDETRYVLAHMQVINEGYITRFVATDGHRLHLAEMDPGPISDDVERLDEGLYTLISKNAQNIVIKKAEEIDGTFPNWNEIVGDYFVGDPLSEICHIQDPGKIGEIMIRTHKLLDTNLLTQALGYGTSRKPKDSVHVQFQVSKDDAGPVTIAHDDGTAFVMPMRRAEAQDDDTDDTPSHITAPFEALKDKLKKGDSITASVDGKEIFKIEK